MRVCLAIMFPDGRAEEILSNCLKLTGQILLFRRVFGRIRGTRVSGCVIVEGDWSTPSSLTARDLGVNYGVIVPTKALVVPSSAVYFIGAAAEWRCWPLDVGRQATSYPNMVDN